MNDLEIVKAVINDTPKVLAAHNVALQSLEEIINIISEKHEINDMDIMALKINIGAVKMAEMLEEKILNTYKDFIDHVVEIEDVTEQYNKSLS